MKKFTILVIFLITVWLVATAILAFCDENTWKHGWKPGISFPEEYFDRIILLELENKRLKDEVTFWKNTAYELLTIAKSEREFNHGQ